MASLALERTYLSGFQHRAKLRTGTLECRKMVTPWRVLGISASERNLTNPWPRFKDITIYEIIGLPEV